MKNTPEHILFGPSGCLSREGLLLFAAGKLDELELTAINAHLQTCEFCAMAMEGMVMADPEEFNQDLETIYASLKDVEVPKEELVPKFVEGMEEVRKISISQKSLFKRYRLEMIAAILLILIAIGSRQIYMSLLPENQQSELAQIEPEDIDETEVIHQEITKRDPLAEERLVKRPTPLKTVEISVVSNDELVLDNQEDIYAPVAEPSNKNAQRKAASAEIEEEHNASGIVMEMQVSMEEEVEGVDIFVLAENMPEFPGGDKKRIEFLAQNIKYPHEARESGVEGTVYVGFIVEKDGSINDAKVLRGIGKGCEDEALRVIRQMPKWEPGTQRRRPVRVQITLPITFTLGK